MNNDITLLKLSSPAQLGARVSPVCLATAGESLLANPTCVTTGWGRTSGTGTYAQPLGGSLGVRHGAACASCPPVWASCGTQRWGTWPMPGNASSGHHSAWPGAQQGLCCGSAWGWTGPRLPTLQHPSHPRRCVLSARVVQPHPPQPHAREPSGGSPVQGASCQGRAASGCVCVWLSPHLALMGGLFPSEWWGRPAAAGGPAPGHGEPVPGILGQPHHQLHALRWGGRRLLLPGKDL